ncbi:hypothetical protein ABBQ38_003264 [Trebouxia sp. C0009 RCD-2024]
MCRPAAKPHLKVLKAEVKAKRQSERTQVHQELMAIKTAAIDLVNAEQEGPQYSFKAAKTTDAYRQIIVSQTQAMARKYQIKAAV